MLQFGLNFGGKSSGGAACIKLDGEQWSDSTLTCGEKAWSTNAPGYTGSVTFDNGQASLIAGDPDPAYYSLVPDNEAIPAGKYLVEVDIAEVNAVNGWKLSVRDASNTWWDLIDGTSSGLFKKVVDVGEIVKVNIGHKSATDGERIVFDTIRMLKINETRTPCMTNYTNPYGEVSASHELTDYWAWKGIDCSNTSTRYAWLTPSIPNGYIDPTLETVWFQWQLTDDDLTAGMPLMIPTKVVIAPRVGMTESWWTANNPYKMRIKGIRQDGTMFDIMDYQTDDWIGAGSRTIDLPLTEECRGLRVVVLGTKGWEGGGSLHTGWGASYFEGVYSNVVTHEGEIVYFENEEVTYGTTN